VLVPSEGDALRCSVGTGAPGGLGEFNVLGGVEGNCGGSGDTESPPLVPAVRLGPVEGDPSVPGGGIAPQAPARVIVATAAAPER
jgi:hypothetical protein